MLELLMAVIFIWLLVKAAGLAFRLTWGAAKIAASLLMVIALPAMIVCLVFVGGIAPLVPIAVVGIAVAVLKACT